VVVLLRGMRGVLDRLFGLGFGAVATSDSVAGGPSIGLASSVCLASSFGFASSVVGAGFGGGVEVVDLRPAGLRVRAL